MWYTGNGDSGASTTFGCSQTKPKDHVLFSVLGHFDELNAYLGVIKTGARKELALELGDLQQSLFVLQAQIGGSSEKIKQGDVTFLESRIDAIEKSLPPLRSFVLSGGVRSAAELDYARTIARRAERALITLHRKEEVDEILRAYTNRLSSYLFALSREENATAGVVEENPHYRRG